MYSNQISIIRAFQFFFAYIVCLNKNSLELTFFVEFCRNKSNGLEEGEGIFFRRTT